MNKFNFRLCVWRVPSYCFYIIMYIHLSNGALLGECMLWQNYFYFHKQIKGFYFYKNWNYCILECWYCSDEAGRYTPNLERCVNVDKGTMHGMKSHDCYVFMESLIRIAFSSFPPHVLNPLIEISHLFKDLCSTNLMEDDLSRMEQNIPFILCKLERIFPPIFLIQWNINLFIWHMKLDLMDQSNINRCIHLKGNKIIIIFYLKFICLMLINHDLWKFVDSWEILNK